MIDLRSWQRDVDVDLDLKDHSTHQQLSSSPDCTMPNKPTTILQVWRCAVAALLVLGCAASAEDHEMVRPSLS